MIVSNYMLNIGVFLLLFIFIFDLIYFFKIKKIIKLQNCSYEKIINYIKQKELTPWITWEEMESKNHPKATGKKASVVDVIKHIHSNNKKPL